MESLGRRGVLLSGSALGRGDGGKLGADSFGGRGVIASESESRLFLAGSVLWAFSSSPPALLSLREELGWVRGEAGREDAGVVAVEDRVDEAEEGAAEDAELEERGEGRGEAAAEKVRESFLPGFVAVAVGMLRLFSDIFLLFAGWG